ncbi:MAG TPA: TRAP transporter small permease [Burkholderiales bacterium]|nr:TRAP transporter small permease [Burkholderiales bacterium]
MKLVEKIFGYVAAAFLAAMMLLTVADVALRSLFKTPIHGTFELIELGLACAVFLAMPAVFLRDENLIVDAIDYMVGRRVVRVLDLVAACLSAALLGVTLCEMVPLARDMVQLGDVTADLSIPKIYYWIPVLLGIAGSAVATVVYIARWRSKA